MLVKKKVAKAHGWQVGDTVEAEFAQTGKQSLRVAGIYDRTGGFVESDYILGLPAQEAFAGERLDANAIVILDEGADLTEVKDRVAAALADHPDTRVLDQEEFEKVASGFIDKLLTFVSVMLLLAVLIALLGIVNTLALSVHERTRELGLLRAVGATRGQVRAMVRWESVGHLADRCAGRGRPRDRHRRRAGPGAQGRRDQGHLGARPADHAVRRTGGRGRHPRRGRPGQVGRPGGRAQGGGDRLTTHSLPADS